MFFTIELIPTYIACDDEHVLNGNAHDLGYECILNTQGCYRGLACRQAREPRDKSSCLHFIDCD
jgi:hypothetical protein